MASFKKLPSGRWQARVKRGGQAMAKSFSEKCVAKRWARDTESRLEQGVSKQALRNDLRTLGDLMDHYLVTLDTETAERARDIGGGSISKGIRKAVRKHG